MQYICFSTGDGTTTQILQLMLNTKMAHFCYFLVITTRAKFTELCTVAQILTIFLCFFVFLCKISSLPILPLLLSSVPCCIQTFWEEEEGKKWTHYTTTLHRHLFFHYLTTLPWDLKYSTGVHIKKHYGTLKNDIRKSRFISVPVN